jgi:hypothetical protein
MKTKKMERVAKFTTQRLASMDFAYICTAICNYLSLGDSSKINNMKRRGTLLGGSSSKKLHGVAFISSAGYGGDQFGGAGGNGDNMDLD